MKIDLPHPPDADNEDTERSRIEKPRVDFLTAVFTIIVFLLFAFQTWGVLKDLAEGKQPPYLWNGAPPPCVPPSQGAWPDCHEPEHK